MKGVVKVGPRPSEALSMSVFVGDYEAEYITDFGKDLMLAVYLFI